jgi:hypothetical protein
LLQPLRFLAALALLAGVGPAAQAARNTEIPFRVPGPDAPYVLMEARLGGRGPFTLLLDTGNATPFIVALSPDAARRAGARAGHGAPFISNGSVGGPVRLDPWTVPQLSLGPVTLTDVSAGVTDAVDRAGRGLGIRLDGIIGHHFLANLVVAIDYACRRVDFAAAAPPAPPTASFTFAPRRPLLLVTGRVNGRGPWSFALDTGSGNTIISPAAARTAGVTTTGRTELAGAGGIERELAGLVRDFPALKIVFEHITTAEAVAFVEAAAPNVAATVTPHHLLLNRNAIFAGGIRPHAYCLPVAKRERHRLAVRRAAVSGSPKFFLGTDSAPHAVEAKETGCGCAGIFNAPFALESYAAVFEAEGALDRFEAFASENGAIFYGLPLNEGSVTLERAEVVVPDCLPAAGTNVVPFLAGETLGWRFVG